MPPKQMHKNKEVSSGSNDAQGLALFAQRSPLTRLKSKTLSGQGEGPQGPSRAEKHYRFTTRETPISANRYWRVANGRIYVSKEAEAFKHIVAWEARRAGVPCISDQPVEVKIYYYHQHPKRRLDVDNIIKIGVDSLSGVAFDNDKRVVKVSAECWHDAEHPRLTFDITYRGTEEKR